MSEGESVTYNFDSTSFDYAIIREWLASTYWSPGITLEKVKQSFSNSTLGIIAIDNGRPIAVARCISDTVRFGYLCDVFVVESHRRRGLARDIVQRLMDHSKVANVENWYLLTRDAQPVYRGLGFEEFSRPTNFMHYPKSKIKAAIQTLA